MDGCDLVLVLDKMIKLVVLALLRCLFTVAAADGLITGDESNEIMSIGEEIGLARGDVMALRGEFRDSLAELRKLPGEND